jgi:tetratricopeptide (TPR) repeat protein
LAPDTHRTRRRSLPPWLRELAPALLPLVGLPLLVVLFAATPASPWALHRADARLGAGDPTGAIDAYQAVARWSVWPNQAREATWRAASLAASSAGEPLQARRLFRTFLKAWPEDPRIAQARLSLARLEWLDFGRPDRAARQYTWAVREAPDAPLAADWLQRAGDAWLRADEPKQARASWKRIIAEYPESAPGAHLSLARLDLVAGEVERAYGHFQSAAVQRSRGPESTLARLGMSLCLEQLADLEAALAELDEVADELPHDVWQERRSRLIERRHKASGGAP